jgi:ketosteroid isomerase-like protein
VTLSADDRIELHELVAHYGNVVDARDLDALGTVYTDDATFTLVTASGREVHKEGLAEIGEFLAASNSTNAHILTNVTTAVDGAGNDEAVILRYRMSPPPSTRVGGADSLFSIDYRDVVVRTDAGWRIADHTITMRPVPGA